MIFINGRLQLALSTGVDSNSWCLRKVISYFWDPLSWNFGAYVALPLPLVCNLINAIVY